MCQICALRASSKQRPERHTAPQDELRTTLTPTESHQAELNFRVTCIQVQQQPAFPAFASPMLTPCKHRVQDQHQSQQWHKPRVAAQTLDLAIGQARPWARPYRNLIIVCKCPRAANVGHEGMECLGHVHLQAHNTCRMTADEFKFANMGEQHYTSQLRLCRTTTRRVTAHILERRRLEELHAELCGEPLALEVAHASLRFRLVTLVR